MSYKCVINTNAYELQRCSRKNWEPGTVNDFMVALNGWNCVERTLQEVAWRINMLCGTNYSGPVWDNEKGAYTKKFNKWLHRKKNFIKYYDRLCEFDRVSAITAPGFCQGYVDVDKKISELKKNGEVRIYFDELYDIRQNPKRFKDCYMEISRT